MFYENLDKILKKKNLTLNKLAKGTGIAQSQTTKWKKGFLPGSEILIKVCKYLEISSDYLLDLNPEAPPTLTDQEQDCVLCEDPAAEELISNYKGHKAGKLQPYEARVILHK